MTELQAELQAARAELKSKDGQVAEGADRSATLREWQRLFILCLSLCFYGADGLFSLPYDR